MEPTTLHLLCQKLLGKDYFLWDTETIIDTLQEKTNGSITEEHRNIIPALSTLFVTDLPYKTFPVFEKVVWALNGYNPRMDVMEIPPIEFINYAFSIMKALGSEEFGEDVKKYIAAILNEEGFVICPDELEEAQEYLNKFQEDKELNINTKKRWEEYKKDSGKKPSANLSDPISVQLDRLSRVHSFMENKQDILKQEAHNG